MNWEEKYNKLAEDVCGRDYHIILAVTATTSLLNPSYSPSKPNDIVQCIKELVENSLVLEQQFGKVDAKYEVWKSSMDVLSEWNEELETSILQLEDSVQQLAQENKELKSRLGEL